jgi:hypothetical protein
MNTLSALVARLSREHADNGYCNADTVAELSARISSLPNDSALDLKIIDSLTGLLGFIVGDINSCNDLESVRRYADEHQAVYGALRAYLRKA